MFACANKPKLRYKAFLGKIKIDIFLYDDHNFIFMKFMLESPKHYNVRIRNVAKTKGYKLSQNGLFKKMPDSSYKKIYISSERQITKILGITYRNIYDRN